MSSSWVVFMGFLMGSLGLSRQSILWIVDPVDAVVFEGETVTLSCAINYALTGYDNHHWVRLDPSSEQQSFLTEGKYVSAALTADKRRRYSVEGQASSGGYTLRMSQATHADSGLFGCLVYSRTNVHRRSLSSFAKVDVVPRALPSGTPSCKVEPPHPGPGTSVQFSCSSMVGGSMTNLSWSLDGEPLGANNVVATDRSVLAFRKTLGDMDNQAVYTCTERWPAAGSQRASCSIVPFDLPLNVTVEPIRVHAVSGEAVTFACNAESVPPATSYTWYFEGHPVLERPQLFRLRDQGRRMTIERITGEDFSKYTVRCTVDNALGMRRSATAFLDVVPLSQRKAMLERKLRNQSLEAIGGGREGDRGQARVLPGGGGRYDGTLITVLIALTASVGTAILLVLAMVLIACLRRPLVKRRLSAPEDGDQQPLHVSSSSSSFPLQEVLAAPGSPPTRTSSTGRARRRPLSTSSYQPLRRDLSGEGPRKTPPPRKVSLPAVPRKHLQSISLYENAGPIRLSLADGLDCGRASQSNHKGPIAPVSI